MSLAIQVIALALTVFCYAGQSPAGKSPHTRLELRLAELQPAKGLKEAKIEATNETIYLHKESVVTEQDLIEASAVTGYGSFDILVVFSREGAEKMSKASQEHIGKPLAILIDGKVVSAPVLRTAISDSAVISGSFTREQAEKLVSRLKASKTKPR